MNIPLFLETISYLRATQVFHQLKYRLFRPKLGKETASSDSYITKLSAPIPKPRCYDGDKTFTFLNISSSFQGWDMGNLGTLGDVPHYGDMKDFGPLWTYNLNYMDWIEQEDISPDQCLRWIDQFILELPNNHTGQDPYPIALRIINWSKFFSKHPECQSQKRNDSMYAQTLLLERKLEYHLLGNHLLEDSYSLTIAAVYFRDKRLFRKASRLLCDQLNEQILPDGAHYEQSPMYHCILLDRLLDCINFSRSNELFDGQRAFTDFLCQKARAMLGHLQSIIYADGTIPLLNDSAYGIAPTPAQLFQYAQRLELSWEAIPLNECGYRRLVHGNVEAIADIGNITATYQPGHSHADTFNYELRIDGHPVIVDTGISTYNKNDRRQYERSTCAHNTVTINQKNSSRVWGGFRLGKRAVVSLSEDTPQSILASHNGFGNGILHQRRFSFNGNSFCVEDEIIGSSTPAISYLHIAPQLDVQIASPEEGTVRIGSAVMKVEHYKDITLRSDYVATEYNRLQQGSVLEISFASHLKYSIG